MSRSASADHFKRATRRAAAAQTPEERVERALALGRTGLELYAAAHGLTVGDARAQIAAHRAALRARPMRAPDA